jgi:quinol monooxygenase YgiN
VTFEEALGFGTSQPYRENMMKTLLCRFLLCALMASPVITAQADQNAPTTFAVITHIDLLPDTTVPNVETGIQLLKNYVDETRTARGNNSAVLITWAPTNNHFQVIETWSSKAAFEAHIGTASVIAFRNSLQGLIGSPYEQRLYRPVDVPSGRRPGDSIVSPF